MSRQYGFQHLEDLYLEGLSLEEIIETLSDIKIRLQTDKNCLKEGDPMYHSEPHLSVDSDYDGRVLIELEQYVYKETLEEAEKRTIKQKEKLRALLRALFSTLESEL